MNEFTCEKCLQTFSKGWTDEEALKEYAIVPWNVSGHEKGLLCDDCFEAFKIWFANLTEEDHKRYRDEV